MSAFTLLSLSRFASIYPTHVPYFCEQKICAQTICSTVSPPPHIDPTPHAIINTLLRGISQRMPSFTSNQLGIPVSSWTSNSLSLSHLPLGLCPDLHFFVKYIPAIITSRCVIMANGNNSYLFIYLFIKTYLYRVSTIQ